MIKELFKRCLDKKAVYYSYVEVVGKLLFYRSRQGINIIDKEWDNLIVLDACRFDKFKDINSIEGKLRKVKSKGTATPQWLKRNFKDYYENVVYISGNPYLSKLAHEEDYFDPEEHFFHVEDVWDYGWDEELNTTPPREINKAVLKLRKKYPEKRFIIHYMQPHSPFIGEIKSLKSEKDGWAGKRERWMKPEAEKAYDQNLQRVLSFVENLIPSLEGKTVITSDHGEVLNGKYGFIRHPKDIFIKELQEVPWFLVKNE